MNIGKKEFNWGSRTYIMGILNRTPDSFSDGGQYIELEKAAEHAFAMAAEGADIIDVGGESTRPGFAPVSAGMEIERVVPLIEKLSRTCDIPISVDTYRAETAEAAIQAGAAMINDIWGLMADPQMADVAARYQTPVCIMHNKQVPEYDNLIEDVKKELHKSVELALKSGIKAENIILDPGIGFGKTYEHNILLMRNLEQLKALGFPVLLGISRKSMIGLTLDLPISQRLEGTIAANVLGIVKGADIIRVHDVEANWRAAEMTDKIIR
ncbi:MAG: dihydropteroate synthase [Spirochaetaceae bacterium]|jgi:dihydropteroate synthase|nr:dihydropteroate synthase [Spirochaetaceae bacterium]